MLFSASVDKSVPPGLTTTGASVAPLMMIDTSVCGSIFLWLANRITKDYHQYNTRILLVIIGIIRSELNAKKLKNAKAIIL